MTARLPNSCVYAVSSVKHRHHANLRPTLVAHCAFVRRYAQQRTPVRQSAENALPNYDVKDALVLVRSRTPSDPINSARSTLPPPLHLPEQGDDSVFVYWFRIGRAYGGFYKDGVKAVWYNYKAARALRERITKEGGARDVPDAVAKDLITRSEFQILARNDRDIGKLPGFGVLALLFGEWLPLIVPFIPNAVPGTCRIPKQVRGMREKAEERRRISFRRGIAEPSEDQLPEDELDGGGSGDQRRDLASAWPLAFSREYRTTLLKDLGDDQLFHLSSTLGLHSRLWDRIQLPPPASLLRRAINKRLEYLGLDDVLLLRHGGAAKLWAEELHIACEERGVDILGKKDAVIRESLSSWLKRQERDGGWGRALFPMLFRRPNSWHS